MRKDKSTYQHLKGELRRAQAVLESLQVCEGHDAGEVVDSLARALELVDRLQVAWSRNARSGTVGAAEMRAPKGSAQPEAAPHRRAMEESPEDQVRLHAVADYTYEWESWVDVEGRLIWTSPAGECVSGYKAEECLAMERFPLPLVYANDHDVVAKALERAEASLAGAGGEVSFRLHRKDGSIRWVTMTWYAIVGVGGLNLGYRSCIRNISDRSRTPELFGQAEEYLRLAVEVTGLGIWDLDTVTGKLTWSKECKAVFRLDPSAELDFDGFLALVHPEDRERVREQVQKTIQSDSGELHTEYRVVWPDGAVRWVEANGRVLFNEADGARQAIRMVGTVADITDRKQVEEERLEGERFVRSVIDSLKDNIAILDENGVIRHTNRAWRTFALQNACLIPADMIGYNYLATVESARGPDAGMATAAAAGIRDVIAGRRDEFSLEYPCDSPQEKRWCRMHVTRFPEGGPLYVVIAHENITDRKNYENALRDSEERFRRVFDQSPIGAAIVSLDYRYVRVNAELCRITGYSEEELLHRRFAEITHPDDRGLEADKIVRLAAGELDQFQVDKRYIRKDGQVAWVRLSVRAMRDADGRPLFFLPMMADINDRKQAEDALHDSEAVLRQFVENTPVAVAMFDRNMRYLIVSRRWLTDYRLGDQNIIGRSHYDVFPEIPLRTPWWKVVHDRCLAGAVERRDEDAFVRSDGTTDWLRWEVRPWFDSDGAIGGVIMFTEVITDLKRTQEQLKALNETLEQRVAERTAVAERRSAQLRKLAIELTQAEQSERRRLAQLLHDHLQQLLVAARFNVDLLRGRSRDADVRESADKVNNLLVESIKASRSLAVELSPPVLYEAGLAAAIAWLGRQMHDKHGLVVDIEADNAAVPASEDISVLLFQAVRELLFNVVKHAKVKQARVQIKRLEGDLVQITVADEGVGFDPHPLQDSKDAYTGFGLFSIGERLGLIGGRIEVDGAPGKGTRVTLVAPVRQAAGGRKALAGTVAEPAEQADAEAIAIPSLTIIETGKPRIRVMLVDDHSIVRQGLAGLLRREPDIEVIADASDGATAVQLARQLRPDVVVMDISMPGMNGIEATRHIVQESPQVRVVGLSMYQEEDHVRAMREAGAVACLGKGGPSESLIAAIRACAMEGAK